jgi:ribosomal protein S18 acetylase RimI-like enzyme
MAQCRLGDVFIRRAGASDLSTIMAVEAACFDEERYSRDLVLFILSDEEFASFLAEDGGMVGVATVHVKDREAHLVSIGVVPERRGHGVARALMDAAEREAIRRGASRMELQVSVLNVAAMNMYLRRGYRVTHLLKDYYGGGKDAYLMERAL